jgi:hypothetical protein
MASEGVRKLQERMKQFGLRIISISRQDTAGQSCRCDHVPDGQGWDFCWSELPGGVPGEIEGRLHI